MNRLTKYRTIKKLAVGMRSPRSFVDSILRHLWPPPPPPRRHFSKRRDDNTNRCVDRYGRIRLQGAVVAGLLEPGATAECVNCGTAVVHLKGLGLGLWCHGVKMRIIAGVPCNQHVSRAVSGGLVAGDYYLDAATSSALRCIRAGGGWPTSVSGRLIPVGSGYPQAGHLGGGVGRVSREHLCGDRDGRGGAGVIPGEHADGSK